MAQKTTKKTSEISVLNMKVVNNNQKSNRFEVHWNADVNCEACTNTGYSLWYLVAFLYLFALFKTTKKKSAARRRNE